MNSVFILDTSVLYEWQKGKNGFGHEPRNEKLAKGIDTLLRTEKIVLPRTVIFEFMSQYFHTCIDLDNYDLWFRKRKAAINPLWDLIFTAGNVSIASEKMPVMRITNSLCEKIPEVMIQDIQRKYAKWSIEKQQERKREPKLLDGMDAAILHEAVQTARNTEAQCVLLSLDYGMVSVVNKGLKHLPGVSDIVPLNLGAKFISR